jgi:pimeloyl-ACP methyl ester carboxylesterase
MQIQLPDARLFARTTGHGSPALLGLHGGPGLDHRSLHPLETVSVWTQVVTYDQRGHGRSTGLSNGQNADHDVWIDDVERVRARLFLDRPIIFGHAWGAHIALEYALRYPGRIGALILCSAAPSSAGRPALRSLSADALGDGLHGPLTPRIREIFAGIRRAPASYERGGTRIPPEWDVSDRLAEVAVPTLVLHGRHDRIVPVDAGGAPLAAGIPDARLVVMEHSGHFPFIEESVGFTHAVREWLASRRLLAGTSDVFGPRRARALFDAPRLRRKPVRVTAG